MGQDIPYDQLPDAQALPETYFAAPTISSRAIDRASQIVPDEHWKSVGLHSWLAGRAKQAFEKLEVGKRDVTLGKLTYRFNFDDPQRPALDTVMLTP